MSFTVSESEKQELAVVFASLILHDDKAEITGENISKILAAANIAVEPYWPKLFAGLLKGRDVAELLSNVGGGSAPAAAPAAGGAAPAAAGKKEEPKKEEPKEEEEGDMGFSLFD